MALKDTLEARITALEDVEAIKKLKAKYWRCVDKKLWDEIADCFTRDAVADYGANMERLKGRKAIVKFLKDSLGRDSVITAHRGHNPEIDIKSDRAAAGTWALSDFIIMEPNTRRRGWGFYEDEYVKERGQWRKKSTKMRCLLEEWETRRR